MTKTLAEVRVLVRQLQDNPYDDKVVEEILLAYGSNKMKTLAEVENRLNELLLKARTSSYRSDPFVLEIFNEILAAFATEQQAREVAEHYHERDIKYINEQANFRLERFAEQLKFTEHQRDEFLKIIVDGRALQSPPPIIIESGAELKSLQSDNERLKGELQQEHDLRDRQVNIATEEIHTLKGSLAQAGHLIESYREAEVKWQAELAASREENLRLNGLIGEACVDLGKAQEECARLREAIRNRMWRHRGDAESCARYVCLWCRSSENEPANIRHHDNCIWTRCAEEGK